MLTIRRALVATGLTAALLLSGCAEAPGAGGDDAATGPYEYCARMVTNSGGLDDRSFNQSTWAGLEQAEADLGIGVEALVSTGPSDLEPNVTAAVDSGCPLVITVGYELADPTLAAAEANPETHFAIVDEAVTADNIKPVVFDTAQASYLAGYLAAGVSRTGVVATFGGGNQPPVTLFMDGFVDGVAAYNAAHGTAVRALGWDKSAQDGVFTGDFEDINKGRTTAQAFIDQGADVILPVAAQVGEGAATAALEAGDVAIVWVDNDGYETLDPALRPVLLTSVIKNTADAIEEIVADDVEGDFSSEPFVGTLENGGVGLAPYHDLADRVSPELQAELDDLQQRIVSGEVVVESPSAP